jgi:hypothetical protein
MIRFTCPTCSCLMEIAADQAGQKIYCIGCRQKLQIPKPPRPAGKPVPTSISHTTVRPEDFKEDFPEHARPSLWSRLPFKSQIAFFLLGTALSSFFWLKYEPERTNVADNSVKEPSPTNELTASPEKAKPSATPLVVAKESPPTKEPTVSPEKDKPSAALFVVAKEPPPTKEPTVSPEKDKPSAAPFVVAKEPIAASILAHKFWKGATAKDVERMLAEMASHYSGSLFFDKKGKSVWVPDHPDRDGVVAFQISMEYTSPFVQSLDPDKLFIDLGRYPLQQRQDRRIAAIILRDHLANMTTRQMKEMANRQVDDLLNMKAPNHVPPVRPPPAKVEFPGLSNRK